MIFAKLNPKTQMILTIAIPLVCILLGVLLVVPAVNGISRANREIVDIKQEIAQKQQLIEQAEMAAGGRPLAVAVEAAREEEPIEFLRQLAMLADESEVTLASIRETTPPPLPSPNPGSAQTRAAGAGGGGLHGERPVVPPSVRELTSQVTVEGTYGEILELILRLEKFDRILSVSKCQIRAGGAVKYPNLQAVFTLSRFVAIPMPPQPPQGEASP